MAEAISPIPLRTKAGFLAAVSSDVRNAFLKIKETIPPEPIIKKYKPPTLRNTPELIIKEPLKNADRQGAFAKVRQRNSYELITRHLLQALQKEAAIVQQQESSTTHSKKKHHETSFQATRPSSPSKKIRRGTERRRTNYGKSTKDRHYFYKKHHLPTPPFVRRLAAKYRVDTDFNGDVSQSPEPKRGLSIVEATADKSRGFQRNAGISNNPYVKPESPSLMETGKFVKASRQLQRVTLPVLGPNRLQTETIQLRDKKFRVPILNFDQRAMVQKFKAARNNPEYLAGIRVECGQDWRFSDKSYLVGTTLPLPDSQLLATVRRDRKMQVNKKLNIVWRTRNMNRKETKLALRKRKVKQMQDTLTNLDTDMMTEAERNEKNAIEHEVQLRRSDQQTIIAIHTANLVKSERADAEKMLARVEEDNNLLVCHNVRQEEEIKLIDRFISVLYAAVPDDIKKIILRRRRREKRGNISKFEVEEIKTMPEILSCYKSFSQESKIEFSEDTNEGGSRMLRLLFDHPSDVFPYLDELYRKSKEACHTMGQLRFESRGLRTKVGIEGEFAAGKNRKIQHDCERVEEEIRLLEEDIGIIRANNDLYETGELRRDRLRRSIDLARQQIFRYYRRNFETPEESIKKMLHRMHAKVTGVMTKFQDIPLMYVRKCYLAARSDPTLEDYVAEEMIRRTEHDMRMQKYYYKSLDPPEIIWSRPNTPNREVDEFVASQLENGYNLEIRTSVDFDSLGAMDTDTWLASRVRQLTELEFEGIPSPIMKLEERENDEQLQNSPEMFSSALHHQANWPEFYLSPPEAQAIEEILKDIDSNLDGKIVHDNNLENESVIIEEQEAKLYRVNLREKKLKSYPDLTTEDIERDHRIKRFLDNYATMMQGGENQASEESTPTETIQTMDNDKVSETTQEEWRGSLMQSQPEKGRRTSRDSRQRSKS